MLEARLNEAAILKRLLDCTLPLLLPIFLCPLLPLPSTLLQQS